MQIINEPAEKEINIDKTALINKYQSRIFSGDG